jgi:spore germination protein YaaH
MAIPPPVPPVVKRHVPILPIILFVVALAAVAGVLFYDRIPNWRMAPAPTMDNPVLVIGGIRVDERPVIAGDTLLLPFDVIKKHIDPDIHWDEKAQSVIVTTRDRVIKMRTDSLTAYVNRRPTALNVPATMKDNEVYVPMDVLESLYKVKGRVVAETGTIFFDLLSKPVQTATVSAGQAALRTGPSIHDPILKKMTAGDRLQVVKQGEWYVATAESGHFGYVREKDIALGAVITPKIEAAPAPEPWRPATKINLTWEMVAPKNPDVASLKEIPGLNVVSPTWFSIADDAGTVKNKADARYVRWAHSKGYKVWALVDNGFDPKRSTAILKDLERRESVIQQLLAYAALYGLDGINVDFENVNYDDRALLVQFVRELAPLCREQGLVVSMDVTVKSTSLNWSMVYDRKALGEAVDYLMLMAYDQYTTGSRVSGSVGTLPWAEQGVQGLLEDVPPQKVILGVPFYTRLWREETKSGVFTITSRALGMEQVEEILRSNQAVIQWDASARQNYAVYREGGAQCRAWLEDESSMALRVELVQKYALAGIASWRRGFEKPSIWYTIANGLAAGSSQVR